MFSARPICNHVDDVIDVQIHPAAMPHSWTARVEGPLFGREGSREVESSKVGRDGRKEKPLQLPRKTGEGRRGKLPLCLPRQISPFPHL